MLVGVRQNIVLRLLCLSIALRLRRVPCACMNDSQEHLVELLMNMSLSDFQNVSSRIANRTTSLLDKNLAFWDGVLSKIASLNASGRVKNVMAVMRRDLCQKRNRQN